MKLKYPKSLRPRQFKLTPSRKGLGNSIARGKPLAIARKCLNNQAIRKHVISCLGQQLRQELSTMCSDSLNSCLRTTNVRADFSSFSLDNIIQELEDHAPLFLQFLVMCMNRKSGCHCTAKSLHATSKIAIVLCASVILKQRRSCMSLIQKVVAVILYSGHASKMVSQLGRCGYSSYYVHAPFNRFSRD